MSLKKIYALSFYLGIWVLPYSVFLGTLEKWPPYSCARTRISVSALGLADNCSLPIWISKASGSVKFSWSPVESFTSCFWMYFHLILLVIIQSKSRLCTPSWTACGVMKSQIWLLRLFPMLKRCLTWPNYLTSLSFIFFIFKMKIEIIIYDLISN